MKTVEQLGISPAPWTKRGDCSTYGEILAADDTLVVDYDWNASSPAEPNDEPNALLISAAPELYEALRGLLEIVCGDCNSAYNVDGKCVKCPRVVAAEAALEKAGGAE